MAIVPLARAPFERKSIDIPTWDQWLTKLVTAVNDIAAGGGSFDAGNLTGTTLAPNVVNSSLTSVGTLTGGATGAGFTINLTASTVTGVLTVPNGGTGLSTLAVNRIPYGNGTSAFQSDADLTFDGSTLTLNGLANLSGAAGGQIQFPATQNPSAGANTLDDYKEGTWTPADASGAGLALTFTADNFQTLKWGQGVMASFRIIYPVTASGAANAISGIPVAQTTTNSVYGGFITASSLGVNPQVRVLTALGQLSFINPATNIQYTNAALSAATLQGVVLYRAAG